MLTPYHQSLSDIPQLTSAGLLYIPPGNQICHFPRMKALHQRQEQLGSRRAQAPRPWCSRFYLWYVCCCPSFIARVLTVRLRTVATGLLMVLYRQKRLRSPVQAHRLTREHLASSRTVRRKRVSSRIIASFRPVVRRPSPHTLTSSPSGPLQPRSDSVMVTDRPCVSQAHLRHCRADSYRDRFPQGQKSQARSGQMKRGPCRIRTGPAVAGRKRRCDESLPAALLPPPGKRSQTGTGPCRRSEPRRARR